MSDGAAPKEEVYCPRCFTIVEDELVFCQECGQFIYANAPADTRAWDSRVPELPDVELPDPAEAIRITLPEDRFPRPATTDADEKPTERGERDTDVPDQSDEAASETDTEPV